jgi:hypothetical protein
MFRAAAPPPDRPPPRDAGKRRDPAKRDRGGVFAKRELPAPQAPWGLWAFPLDLPKGGMDAAVTNAPGEPGRVEFAAEPKTPSPKSARTRILGGMP